ncbi:hypothetical protein AAY473_013188 [Plecturocebus cupreus]
MKISWPWWRTPVIPATQESEARELLEAEVAVLVKSRKAIEVVASDIMPTGSAPEEGDTGRPPFEVVTMLLFMFLPLQNNPSLPALLPSLPPTLTISLACFYDLSPTFSDISHLYHPGWATAFFPLYSQTTSLHTVVSVFTTFYYNPSLPWLSSLLDAGLPEGSEMSIPESPGSLLFTFRVFKEFFRDFKCLPLDLELREESFPEHAGESHGVFLQADVTVTQLASKRISRQMTMGN